MSSRYLLPCVCGEQIAVELRQAGESVTCRCGATLQAPTLREICALERAADESSVPRAAPSWSWRHGVRLLGGATVLLAVCWGVWLYLNPPVSRFDVFDPEMIRQNACKLAPAMTLDNWQKAKEGLDRRVDAAYARDLETHHGLCVVAAIVMIAGVGLIVAGTLPLRRPAPAVAG